MDLITPAPSQLNRDFWTTYASNPEQAAWFLPACQKNDYIKVKAIAKNIAFQSTNFLWEFEITHQSL